MKIPSAELSAYLGATEASVDETDDSTPEQAPEGLIDAPAPWRGRLKKWLIIGGVAVVIAPALIFAAWTAVTLSYTYSTGYRAGYVQKISKKGWICPTWEGELQMVNLPGAAPEVLRVQAEKEPFVP